MNSTFKLLTKEEKLIELRESLIKYEERLKHEMKTYRGVIHESAASEIKHSTVMVLRDMVRSITEEIQNLEKELGLK